MGDKVRHTTERGSRSGGQIPRYRLPQASVGYDNLAPALRRDVTASRMAARAVQAEKKVWDRARAITEQGTFLVEKLEGLISEAQLEQAVRETLDRVPVVEGMLADVTGRVETAEASIEDLGDQITLKADKSVLDAVAQRVTTAEARLDVLADEISAKVSQEDFDLLAGRVSTAETTLQIHAGEIAAKASQQEVDLLTGRVTQAEADIVATAGLIQSEVSRVEGKLDSSDPSAWYSSIKQTADGIESVVAMLNSDAQATGQFSSIKQTADAIDSVVSTLNEAPDAPTQFSSIKQTVQEISSIVALLNSDPDAADQFSAITQLAGEIDLRVHQDGVITAINLSPEGVAIQANKVEFLTGPIPKAIPQGATLFHFDHGLRSTGGLAPLPGYVATLRPGEGRFGGAVAVEEGTTNLFDPAWNDSDVETVTDTLFGQQVTAYKLDASQNSSFEDFQTGQQYDAVAGAQYTASFYAKWTGRLTIEPLCYNSSGEQIAIASWEWLENPEPDPSRYQRYVIRFTVPDGAVKCEFFRWHYGTRSTNVAYLAYVQLEAKPFATSFVDGTRAPGKLIYDHGPMESVTLALWFRAQVPDPALFPDWHNILDWITDSSRIYVEKAYGGFRVGGDFGAAGALANYDTEWHQVVLVREQGGTSRAYFDGVLRAEGIGAGVPQTLCVGSSFSAREQINGLYDELLILPYAASEEEIRSWYEQAAPFYDPAQQLQALDNQIWMDSTGLNMQNVAAQNKMMNLDAHRLAFWDANGIPVAAIGNLDEIAHQIDPEMPNPGYGLLLAQGVVWATQSVMRNSLTDYGTTSEKISDGAVVSRTIGEGALQEIHYADKSISLSKLGDLVATPNLNDLTYEIVSLPGSWGTGSTYAGDYKKLVDIGNVPRVVPGVRVAERMEAVFWVASVQRFLSNLSGDRRGSVQVRVNSVVVFETESWFVDPVKVQCTFLAQDTNDIEFWARPAYNGYAANDYIREVFIHNIKVFQNSQMPLRAVIPYATLERDEPEFECNLPCQTSCQTACQQATCEASCESSCMTACQTRTCQSTCEKSCQTTCERSCQKTCERSCQSTCEKTSQSCFIDGTPVTIYDPDTGKLSEIPIETLEPGMFMPYYEPETDRVLVSECISNEPSITATLYEVEVESPTVTEPIVLRVTPEQPFDVWRKNRLTGEWGWSVIQAQYLKPGDKMIRPFDEANRMPAVISVTKLPPQPPTRVWDPKTVSGRYIVAGFADALVK